MKFFAIAAALLLTLSAAPAPAQFAPFMANGSGAVAPPPTPPSVAVTEPSAGATVSGSNVTITSTCSPSCSSIQNKVDTNAVGSACNSSPCSIAWDSTSVGNGTHNITATGTNAGGTVTSSQVGVTVNNAVSGPPTVTMLSPTNTGPTAGGKLVNITGTNFTGATAVKFGTANATSFAVNSSTSIAATSPSGTASNCPGSSCAPVDVTVTTPNGTSVVSTADQFVYANPPTAQATVQLNTNTSGGFVNGATLGFRQVATFTGTSDNGAWNNPASLSTTTALASNGSNGLNNLTL